MGDKTAFGPHYKDGLPNATRTLMRPLIHLADRKVSISNLLRLINLQAT